MPRAAALVTALAATAALLVPVADSAPSRSTSEEGPQIYLIASDGSGQTAITPSAGPNDGPDWSPDGTKLAISSQRDGNWEIYVMGTDGNGATRLTTNRSADDARPAWSPDGSKIAFHSDRTGDYEIYVMNADGSGQTNLTLERSSDDFAPTWSPDGTKIAFQSEGDLYVMNADGSLQTRLTSGADNDLSPDWSPDGSKIAFTGGGSSGFFVDVINSDGSGRTRLTSSAGDYYPEWSPDGTKIAFSSLGAVAGRVAVMNADGTGTTILTNVRKRIDYEAAWAPDGTRLAFAAFYDRVAPEVLVLARSPQRAIKQRSVQLQVACSESCGLRASGVVAIAGQRRAIRLRSATASIEAYSVKQLKLRLPASALRRISATLARGKRVRAVISVRAVDRFGNARTRTKRVKLKR
jgi:Tol biopolymer transport system component